MLINYFLSAWRGLKRDKVTSVVNLFGLCVGMTSAVLILLWVNNELNFDDFHTNARGIYRLTSNMSDKSYTWENTSYPIGSAVKREIPEVSEVTRCVIYSPIINTNGNLTYQQKCAYVDDNWFEFFHYDLVDGDLSSFQASPNSLILSSSEAHKHFGEKIAVGELLKIDSTVYKVVAVVADPPANSSIQFGTLISMNAWHANPQRKSEIQQWGSDGYVTFIKMIEHADENAVEKKVNSVIKDNLKDILITLVGLPEMHFESDLRVSAFDHSDRASVYVFAILAVLLLLVACINYVNLTTARASLFAKEVSVRKIVGANRSHLFNQFVVNSLVVSVLAMVGTIVLVQIGLPLLNILTKKQFVISTFSPMLWQVIGVTLLAAFALNSIYPAILLSSFNPLQVFKGKTVLNINDIYFRKGLVVTQFVISIALIASTLTIYNQLEFIRQRNPGYNRSQVLLIPFPVEQKVVSSDKLNALKVELLKNAAIEQVSLSNRSVVNITRTIRNGMDWEGRESDFNPRLTQLSADANLDETMQLQMKEGRWFDEGSISDQNNFVLNETAVNELRIQKPIIGQRFTLRKNTGQIIGVVKDFNSRSLHEKIEPLMVVNNPNLYENFLVRIGANKNREALARIEEIWRSIFPESPLVYTFLDDEFNKLYEKDQQASTLVFIFSSIAIMISALGLFALSAFVVDQRTKEIGIRKVLGASFIKIIYILTKDFAVVIFIAIALAFPLAWWGMNKWLANFAYRINVEFYILAIAGICALLVAMFAVSLHSIRSANANPVKSLRSE